VPTTIFTPLEYGSIGLMEETAIEQYGEDDIEVYHGNFLPLEWTVPHHSENACYAKLICVVSQNVSSYIVLREYICMCPRLLTFQLSVRTAMLVVQ
jgi:pyruvate/2-oxoglutarate dehydrogenase complex dihydrolipoamide dehydrogenase (E3) component